MKNKTAVVFGSALKTLTESKEYKDTVLIGEILAQNGYRVKCGGYYGIMEAISKGVSDAGGIAIGHTCASFPTTKGNSYLTHTIPGNDIYDRLRLLIEDTDLFIMQRGGVGTLTELFLTMDIVRKMKGDKPKIVLVGEFWKPIIESVSICFNPGEEEMLTIITDYNEIRQTISEG